MGTEGASDERCERRDTPGLQQLPGCGKLSWFNMLRFEVRLTALAVHSPRSSGSERLGRGQQNTA
jgi:hypothetical protein